jgi:hypothetical protein
VGVRPRYGRSTFGFVSAWLEVSDRHRHLYAIDGRDLCESCDGVFNALIIRLYHVCPAPTPGERHRLHDYSTHGSDRANPFYDCYIVIIDIRVRRVIRPTTFITLTTSQDLLRAP